ncbi:ABC transporter ATP-binding protein [Allosphingosinicella deserti]|uniref:Peptide ABC transporter ATP-binding protein n=1 Tax=Allosphingosinicella deserti TaxID=2116704 RepID=A0A2P7QZC3_9SPHN|nr:ABC transporter ATP-binding protein [Sphingomonas deserti]PSJ43311.1 peptide ABC transporter ATP-binding protein [Sphingomonas deserti]
MIGQRPPAPRGGLHSAEAADVRKDVFQTPAASARALTKTFGRGEAKVHALRSVDLDLPRGRFTAIMGPSGSGKSTLMHCLAGLDQADSGAVTIAGTDLGSLDDDELTIFRREHIGFVFQSFNLLPMLTASQNILLPFELTGCRIDEAARARAAHLAEALGVANRLAHRPAELSGGQQQRVAIARALLLSPDLLFADEPTGNLDSAAAAGVLHHLRRTAHELGQTVVMVTHDPVAAKYADDVIIMQDARIV